MKSVVKYIARIFSKYFFTFFFIFNLSVVFYSCHEDWEWSFSGSRISTPNLKTQNIIVVVVDGLRFSEGWGDASHSYIPFIADSMAKYGVVNSRFYNMGPTYTNAGHTSLLTGVYQEIDNNGNELPRYPSVIQYWNKYSLSDSTKSWIITSKGKLKILADCNLRGLNGRFKPSLNCGTDGVGNGYREDSLTLKVALSVFSEFKPNLMLINFRDPDYSAHGGNWNSYIKGVKATDKYVFRLWKFLQSDEFYKNKTALFVTNDHGRHLDGISDGFAGHGDGCDGCRHIGLYAFGPDFRQNLIIDTKREQIDLPVTIAYLLGFSFPQSRGKVMTELFTK
jgi:hypothetical protein